MIKGFVSFGFEPPGALPGIIAFDLIMLDFIIKNANIITMNDAAPVIRSGFVGIENGKISFVSDALPDWIQPSAARIIDADGNIVMPGLVNTHAHTAMCVMRGYADDYALSEWLFKKIFPVEGRLTREAVLAGFRLGIAEMLASGTTSFSDMYFFEPDAAAVVAETGIRASLCNSVLALGDDYDFERDRAVIETRALIRDWHLAANGRIRADVGIHAEYTSRPEHWRKVSELAAENGLVTQLHLSETRRETDECIARYGKTPTEILSKNGVFNTRTLAAHGVHLTKNDMAVLAEKGVSVAHNPVSNLKLASGIANISALIKHGVNVSLGTDGCASNNSHDLFEELKLSALLAKGTSLDPTVVPAYSALKLATVNGAYAQGRENEIGRLLPGFEADLIMLNTHSPRLRPVYDPCGTVVYSAAGADVCLTMVQGKILYENGKWLTLDVQKAIEDVERFAVPQVLGR